MTAVGAGPALDTDPDCVFCRIVAGDAPAHLIHDGPDGVAFLDRVPLFAGHTLVVPRAHHVTLHDLPVERIEPFFGLVRRLSAAVPEAMEAGGTFVAMNNIVSQSVPHLHCHVVPRRRKDGLRGFFWPRTKYADDAEMAEVAGRIRTTLEAAAG